MTPKEKIYAQILKTWNEIDKLNGDNPRYDIDKCLENKAYCNQHTLVELNKELDLALSQLNGKKRKKSVADWYKTPDGEAYRGEHEDKIKHLRREAIDKHKACTEDVGDFIHKYLGSNWRVRCVGERMMTFELLDKDGKHPFGHEFDIYYGHDHRNPDKFEISCSSVGGFDPTQDNDRFNFFIGIKTVSTPEIASELKAIVKSFSEFCYHQNNRIYELENELENPPVNE